MNGKWKNETNLFLIALVQCVLYYSLIIDFIHAEQGNSVFVYLLLSTISTAAAAFTLNNPKKKAIFIVLCAAGFLFLALATVRSGMGIPNVLLGYLMIAGMIWMYHSVYKRIVLVANIIAALFAAIVPLSLLTLINFTEEAAVTGKNGLTSESALYGIIGTAVFLFFIVLVCEIIKDTEDFENDVYYDWHSIPFVMGTPFTKTVIISINIAIAAMLCFLYAFFLHATSGWFSFLYMLLLMIIPLIYISRKVHKAVDGADFRRVGTMMKIIGIVGVIKLFFFF